MRPAIKGDFADRNRTDLDEDKERDTMRKPTLLLLLGAAALTVLIGRQALGVPMQATTPLWVGCWYSEFDGGLKQFVTVNADGTFMASDAADFLPGQAHSPIHGLWEKTGPFEIMLTGLWFEYDASGTHTATWRGRVRSRANRRFDRVTNEVAFDMFLPNQDPLTEIPHMPNAALGTGIGRKVPLAYYP